VDSTEIRKSVDDHQIPAQMVVNIDQTGVKLVPTSEWTLDQKGTSQVIILFK